MSVMATYLNRYIQLSSFVYKHLIFSRVKVVGKQIFAGDKSATISTTTPWGTVISNAILRTTKKGGVQALKIFPLVFG